MVELAFRVLRMMNLNLDEVARYGMTFRKEYPGENPRVNGSLGRSRNLYFKLADKGQAVEQGYAELFRLESDSDGF